MLELINLLYFNNSTNNLFSNHISFSINMTTHIFTLTSLRLLLVSGCLLGFAACTPNPALTPDEPAHLLAKVATTYYFEPTSTSLPNPTITFQNTLFQQAGRSEDFFRYDEQKRLINRKAINPDQPNDGYSYNGEWEYAYTNNQLLKTYLNLSPRTPSIYPLNPQGYVASGTYDSDGILLSQGRTVVDGNIVKEVLGGGQNGTTTTTYEYDLTKSSLPNPYVIEEGRPSRNLVTKLTRVNQSAFNMPAVMPDKTVIVYRYEFDAQGQVVKQIAYEERITSSNVNALERELRINTFSFTK